MSNLALELIAKEKIEKTGILDLGKCGLTELPEELFELVWLEELNITNTRVSLDRKRFINSKNKRGENNFSVIPLAFSKLKNLKTQNYVICKCCD